MSRNGGYVLVELLVASACAALVGAAALTLLLNGASAAAGARSRLHGDDLARACRDALLTELTAALSGLEGATATLQENFPRPRVEAWEDPTGRGLALLLPAGRSAEVEVDGSGAYRVPRGSAAGGLTPGTLVAALPAVGSVAVLGRVASVGMSAAGTGLVVTWTAAAAAHLPEPVRALTPVQWRELAWSQEAGGVSLRRRHAGGTWQPVVDGLAKVEVDFLMDRDADGVADPPLAPPPSAPTVGRIRGARAACQTLAAGVTSSGWAR